DSLPQEIDEVEGKIVQYQIELAALAKEKDKTSKERRERVEQELKELRDRSNVMKAQWQAEQDAITRLQGRKAELEQLRAEESAASSGSPRPWRRSRTPCGGRAPGCRTRTDRPGRSSSSVRPGSARPRPRAPSPNSCSTTRRRWCGSTCPSTWRSTPWRG